MPIALSATIVLVLTFISAFCNVQMFVPPTDTTVHFGITTICSIFAGFLYSNYSILLDFSATKLAGEIKNTDILSKRNKHILQGIISSIISIITGLLLCIKFNTELKSSFYNAFPKIFDNFTYLLYAAELIFCFTTITLFIISLLEMKDIVNSKTKPSNLLSKDTKNKFNKQLHSAEDIQKRIKQ